MTAEMGQRDVDLGLKERFAAQFIRFWAWVVSLIADDVHIRFEPTTATLSLTGESEHSGDRYARGRLAATFVSLNELAMMSVLAYSAMGMMTLPATPITAVIAVVVLVTACVACVSLLGGASLTSKIDVIDHTTAPTPDAIDDLEAQYMADEIDEQELEDRTAEVWANE